MLNRKIGMTIVAGSVLGMAQAALALTPASAVLSDASSRVSLAGETGGHDGKFFLSDGTKANRLNVGGFAQFRYQHSFIDATAPAEDFTHGFQMRKVRVELGGTLGDPNMEFLVNFDFSDASSGADLRDAWGKYNFGNGLYLRAGQYKTGMVREELISDSSQLLVERSQTNAAFSWGRSQGVGIMGSQDNFRWMVDFTDGLQTDGTEYDSDAEQDYGIVGRVEFLAMGKNFDAVKQFSSWTGTADTTGLVGASLGYASGGDTGAGPTGPTGDATVLQLSVDTQWGGDGWNAFGAFHFRSTDTAANTLDDMGFVVQGGYFFQENLEGFARLDSIIPDSSITGNDGDPFTTLSGGLNFYLVPNSQASKVTAQVNYYLDNTGTAGQANSTSLISTGTNNNLLASTEDGQLAIIFQWQLKW